MPVYTKLFAAFFLCVFFSYYFVLKFFVKSVRKSILFSNILLFLASMAFYSYANLKFLPILLILGIITYFSGILYNKLRSHKKIWMIIFIVLQLLPLFASFALKVYARYGGAFDLILPLGLSFFTLQAMTYTEAVYHGRIPVEYNVLNVLLFVCFFPCISSGPIQRAEKLLPQIRAEKQFDYNKAADGLRLMGFGFMKKLVIADNPAIYIRSVRGFEGDKYGLALFLSAVFYSFQLYLDFSGYSDIVIGAATALGYDLGENFHRPYLSHSVGEFWNRWHSSLSSWLRDYIYIPLGGSRTSKIKIYRNILITFAVSGLWHGTGITWLIWGLFHGICLCIERAIGFGKKNKKAWQILTTFILVSFGWIIFSSENMRVVLDTVVSFGHIPHELMHTLPEFMAEGKSFGIALSELFMISKEVHMSVCLIGLIIYSVIGIVLEKKSISGLDFVRQQKTVVRWALYFCLVLSILFFGAANSAEFIYNRF